MNLTEALSHAMAGGRVTCDLLSRGSVVKMIPGYMAPRVVFEATGDSNELVVYDEHKAAVWRKVEGWAV